MDFNRNQFFIAGMVLVLIGLQLRSVESITLNERASKFLAERIEHPLGDGNSTTGILASIGPTPLRTVHPPEWLGFATLSVGAVLVLHSLAMKKPGA